MTISPLDSLRSGGLFAYRQIEHCFNIPFGTANPWRHLGALGFLCFWLLAVSGFYLFAMLDTSATDAYRSIDWLSREQWYLGGLLRSIHRYAADAFIIITLLHLVREFLLGRYTGFRKFSWLTGVPLLWFAYISGVGGFWLNWDQLGQFSAVASAELLDWLPIFSTPMTRNFLSAATVSDRLFSLFVFIHLGVPLLLIFGLWFHVQRINHAEVFPPRLLSIGTCATLLVLALVAPVVSQAPADLSIIPASLPLDWFYLFLHPLMYVSSPASVWLLVAIVTLFLFALPFLPVNSRIAKPAIAEVHADYCNGCRRCFDDCPYAAIVMVPHPNGKPGQQLAKVNPDMCASCGICAGSCPSSTPFRSVSDLVTGIDMPQQPIGDLRNMLGKKLAGLEGKNRIVVFGCDNGAHVSPLASKDVACISLMCTGILPPSFVEYALREGATGVMVTGCNDCGCSFRLGSRWTEARLQGAREPHLRASVSQERLCIAWADQGEETKLLTTLNEFRDRLTKTDMLPSKPAAESEPEPLAATQKE